MHLKKNFTYLIFFLENHREIGEAIEVTYEKWREIPDENYYKLQTIESNLLDMSFFEILNFLWTNILYPLAKQAVQRILQSQFGIGVYAFEVIYNTYIYFS
ncbi:hypothetical protein ACFFRR_010874 [Megaselia abdita]